MGTIAVTLQNPLIFYHSRVKSVFAPCPTDIKIKEVAIHIFTVLIAPLAYPVLGLLYTVGRLIELCQRPKKTLNDLNVCPIGFSPRDNSRESPHKVGVDLARQIEALRAPSPHDWVTQAIQLVRKSRFDGVTAEIQRLRGARVLTREVELKLDHSLDRVNIFNPNVQKTPYWRLRMKVLLGQAIEIKMIYEKTHDVFLHGQTGRMISLIYFIKEMAKKKFPELDLHRYKYLRAPCSVAEPGRTERMINRVSGFFWRSDPNNNAAHYANRWIVSDSDMKVREDLISADAYPYSYTELGSPISFLSNDYNLLQPEAILAQVAKASISHLYPTLSTQRVDSFVQKFLTIPVASNQGNLFVICTPKNRAREYFYLSHPFGMPCRCHPEEQRERVVEKLQSGMLDQTTSCRDPRLAAVPQVRVYTPLLKPGGDDRQHDLFILTPYAKSYRKELKTRLATLAEEIHQAS